jgi:hypothetical protein
MKLLIARLLEESSATQRLSKRHTTTLRLHVGALVLAAWCVIKLSLSKNVRQRLPNRLARNARQRRLAEFYR